MASIIGNGASGCERYGHRLTLVAIGTSNASKLATTVMAALSAVQADIRFRGNVIGVEPSSIFLGTSGRQPVGPITVDPEFLPD